MPFQIVRNDITRVAADAIVNTANPRPTVGWGTDTAVYEAAGMEQLLAERRKIGDIAPGSAVSTPAFRLKAKYIIHTVGPIWQGGTHSEESTLRACYENSLALADRLGCESIAFPLISTGSYGFPRELALHTAMSAIGKFLLTHDMQVILVVFDRQSVTASSALAGEIREYIDEHAAKTQTEKEYPDGVVSSIRRRRDAMNNRRQEIRESLLSQSVPFEDAAPMQAPERPLPMEGAEQQTPAGQAPQNQPPAPRAFYGLAPQAAPKAAGAAPRPSSLEDDLAKALQIQEDTFQQRLFRLIDRSGMDDITVYKKANIDRKLFSAIKCKKNYRPTKKTAVAFAIALELDLPVTLDLLSRAGIAFSPADPFDLIITWFVNHRIYDMMQINTVLFDYDQPLLGA